MTALATGADKVLVFQQDFGEKELKKMVKVRSTWLIVLRMRKIEYLGCCHEGREGARTV